MRKIDFNNIENFLLDMQNRSGLFYFHTDVLSKELLTLFCFLYNVKQSISGRVWLARK